VLRRPHGAARSGPIWIYRRAIWLSTPCWPESGHVAAHHTRHARVLNDRRWACSSSSAPGRITLVRSSTSKGPAEPLLLWRSLKASLLLNCPPLKPPCQAFIRVAGSVIDSRAPSRMSKRAPSLRPALTPTAPLRLRCLVWVDSTSCSSDDADDPKCITAVSRLTPRARPAGQPRTASMAPPRALADG